MTADINSIRKIWSTPAKFKFSIRIRYKLSHLVIQTSSRNHSIPRTALCLFHTSCMGNHHQSTTFVLIAHSTQSISHIMHGQPPPIHFRLIAHNTQSISHIMHGRATTTNPLSFSSRTTLKSTSHIMHGQPPPIHDFRSRNTHCLVSASSTNTPVNNVRKLNFQWIIPVCWRGLKIQQNLNWNKYKY